MGDPLLHRKLLPRTKWFNTLKHSRKAIVSVSAITSLQYHNTRLCLNSVHLSRYHNKLASTLLSHMHLVISNFITLQWHQRHTAWKGQTDVMWLYQSAQCQYLSLEAWGLALRAMTPFHTIEHGIRLTVSMLIWSSLSLSCKGSEAAGPHTGLTSYCYPTWYLTTVYCTYTNALSPNIAMLQSRLPLI